MKLKYTSTLLILLIATFFSVGCEEDTSVSPGIPVILYPININSFWIYDVEGYENDSLLYRSVDTVTVSNELIVWGGSEWMQYEGDTGVYWRNGVDGVWRLVKNIDYPGGIAEKYYTYPAVAGDDWYVATDDDSIGIVSVAETVELSEQLFEECYYYRIIRSDDSRKVSVWIKPGIGIVQQSSLMIIENDTLRNSAKLRDYSGS